MIEELARIATDCEQYRGYVIAVYDGTYIIRAAGEREGSDKVASMDGFAGRASARAYIDTFLPEDE